MEEKIQELKNQFNNILNIIQEIKMIFENLQNKTIKLKDYYKEFINKNNDEKYIFTLDSFRFQSKLIDIELEEMKKYNIIINNRMYCEYFKLFKMISIYINTNKFDEKLVDLITNKNYPIYKDLEPLKEYDNQYIIDIHENIIDIIYAFNNHLKNKEIEYDKYKLNNNKGLNINNFVNTLYFEIFTLKQQIELYISYLTFFHELHTKYFKRFITKMKIYLSQLNHDIVLEDKNSKQTMFNNLLDDNIDINLIDDIKHSLSSENYDHFVNKIINDNKEKYEEFTEESSLILETYSNH